MFGTLVEDEGVRERRWGSVVGVQLGRASRMGRFAGRRLGSWQYNVVTGEQYWADDYGPGATPDTTGGQTPSVVDSGTGNTGPDYLQTVLDTLKVTLPGVLGVVTSAINRGQVPQGGNCPPNYPYYSPIVKRCFQTPQEMSAAETALQQAAAQAGVSFPMNTALLVGAAALGIFGLVMFMRK